MPLTQQEIERYKRHLVLREVGGQGQQKLQAAKVLVVGAGGLGSPVLMYLAAAGVGTLGIVDDDRVSLDNLQRQIVHDTPQRRHAQGREREGGHRPIEPARARRSPRQAHRCRQRHRADLPLRHHRRRLRQLRHPLPRQRRLLPGEKAAGVRRRRPVRRLRHHAQAARGRARRHPLSELPLPLPRGAAAGHGRQLRRGRRARRRRGRDRHLAGHRGAEGDLRRRREPGRPAPAL